MRHRKGIDLDERGDREELGRVKGGETRRRIYYVKIESIFNKRGENKDIKILSMYVPISDVPNFTQKSC